jgi:hypothetical protein
VTLAERIEAVILERGPMPGCEIAPALCKQKAEVLAVLHADPRFVQTGKARASRWQITEVNGIDAADLARRWERELEISAYTAEMFVADFIAAGLLERVAGDGARARVTELGAEFSRLLHEARR